MNGIIGKKLGMTSIFNADGKRLACTVVEAGPCVVTQVKPKIQMVTKQFNWLGAIKRQTYFFSHEGSLCEIQNYSQACGNGIP